jgi:hypothetical protein
MSRLLLSLCLAAASTHAATHWAFQPLSDPTPPPAKDAPTDTDRFFFAKAAADGLQLPPQASARALLRRASYDLTGLPPSPAETDAFLADPSPDGFAKVVDRLLASPAYGEKWGRLWLDVVRYADTAGETADYPMPHAWRYRNWVINAFNHDLPADEFIRWQIAGDLLAPSGPPDQAADKIIATGFLGIARRFGFNIDQDIHLTYEDAIDTTGKAFLGLSLGCARCHDHKHDPVSQRDYYGLYGILQSTRLPFTGCEKTQRPRDMVPILSPAHEQEHLKWQAESKAASDALKAADTALEALTPAFAASTVTPIASGTLTPGASASWPPDAATGTVSVSRGEMLQLSILPRGNFGADGTGIQWSLRETSGQLRQWSLASAFANPAQPDPAWFILDTAREPRLCLHFDPVFENTKGLAAWRGPDLWPSLLVNTLDTPNAYQTLAFPPQSIAVHPGPNGGIAIAFQSQSDGPLALTLTISEFDPGGDGIDWALVRRPSLATTLESQRPLINARLVAAKTAAATAAREPIPDLALAVAESTPVNARLHKKGEPKDPGDAVPRKLPDLFGGDLIPDAAGSGRLQLADWLTRGPARHLTARVLANRLWLGHFSEGLVSTPNDFGTKGAPPSNPALLDWLASRLIADHWSLKSMHRRLMLSATYQRASIGPDGGDHRTAFFPRRRLTAEELRDSLLVLAGNLDPSPAAAHPFPPENSWAFTQHGPFKAVYDHLQRSVYLMVQRTQRHPFLALFDAGDPNASTASRSQSTVPTQALYFLNDPFVHSQAKIMASRLVSAAPDDASRMNLATSLLYSRPASPAELALAVSFLDASRNPSLKEPDQSIDAWSAWIRVLFGTNELLYVD